MLDGADIDQTNEPEEARKRAVQEAVDTAIENMRSKLINGEFKMTVGEFARLLELRKELAADTIRHVKVTWVDSLSTTEPVPGT